MGNANKNIDQMMTKASVWLQTKELERLDNLRGDISRSLFIRRAIRKVLLSTSTTSEHENENVPPGKRLPAQSPQAATAVEDVATTPTTTKEVEAL
jgi:hypothetical protein